MKIADIRIDGGTQPRDSINHEVVAEYSEALSNGAEFPPVIAFYDGSDYWLADGFHRLAAHRVVEREEIAVEVQQGTRREAVLYSVGANAVHGLRRTNADKRRSVMVLLNDDEWSRWSDREIARRCAVDHTFVGRMRSSLATNTSESEPRTYTTKHGTTATMNTGSINASRPQREENGITPLLEEPDEDDRPRRPLVDIGNIPPQIYSRATDIRGNVGRMAELTQYNPEESATGFKEHEKARVVDNARKIIGWLNRLVEALEET